MTDTQEEIYFCNWNGGTDWWTTRSRWALTAAWESELWYMNWTRQSRGAVINKFPTASRKRQMQAKRTIRRRNLPVEAHDGGQLNWQPPYYTMNSDNVVTVWPRQLNSSHDEDCSHHICCAGVWTFWFNARTDLTVWRAIASCVAMSSYRGTAKRQLTEHLRELFV